MAEPAQDQLIFLLSIGTIGVLLLSMFIIIFFFIYQRKMLITQQQKQKREVEFQQQMLYSQLKSQESERVRIASDIHDSLGSFLWCAKVNATYIERSVLLEGKARESYQELMATLDESISVVRRIAWELTPEAFQHTGLSKSILTLCNRVNGKGIEVVFQQNGNKLWQDDRAMHVFRIVQELVSNCIKHAHATKLIIDLTWTEHNLLVNVEDNGIGFNLDEKQTGVGWYNIQQRVRQLKAEITIGKTPFHQGSSIALTIPLAHD
jgi:signal transduction histidine kinase